MSKKFTIVLAVLALAGGGYVAMSSFMRRAPPREHKVDGEVYVLGNEFLVNLSDGYAKLTVALLLRAGALAALEGGEERGARPPEGYGALPQEAVVRDIVTDVLTGRTGTQLRQRDSREQLKVAIVRRIRRQSDVPVADLYFTDVAVQ